MLPWKHGIGKSQLHFFNRIFMMAEQVLKDETCPTCGTPFWLGHSTNEAIGFKRHEETCEACAEQKRMEEQDRKQGIEPGPGVTQYVVAFSEMEAEGIPLPGRREWLEEQQRERLKELRREQRDRG